MAIAIPFIIAALIPFVYKRFTRMHIGWFVLFVPAVLFIALARYVPAMAKGDTYLRTFDWIPSYHIYFSTYLDGLSMILGLLITGVGTLVILYSIYYLSVKESLHRFYLYLLLFMGSMLGVVFSDNMMVLYVFWELTSISSFLLIAFWFHRKKSREGAQKSLLITVSGGFGMLIGFIMLYVMTGTFSVREVIATISSYTDHTLFLPAMLLILLGAFTKSAQFPFHIWLPDAMEAPTPVSAYLHSATMVKAGIYLVARFTPVFGGDATWFWLVSGVGMFTMFWGSFTAVRQIDLKALLAYSTVSQLGLIMSLFGIGSAAYYYDFSASSIIYTQATFAALFHLINHSTFKGALFMIVGILDFKTGTRDLRRLGGLMAIMPVSFTIALIGSFSMAGLPPFNGFLSKEMFFEAVVNIGQMDIFSLGTWGVIFPVLAWVGSVFTFVYCMIIVFQTFFGKRHLEKLERPPREAAIGMLIAPAILALLVVGIFFLPNLLGRYVITPAMASVYPRLALEGDLGQSINAWHGFNTEVMMTLGVIVIGGLLYSSRNYWKGIYNLFPAKWSFDSLFNYLLEQMEGSAHSITIFYMTGSLRSYLVYIYLFFIALTGGTLFYTGALSIELAGDAPVGIYDGLIVLVMIIAALSILSAKSRLTAILLNGVLGYSIAVVFVLLRAPDLALTQIVVETVTTVLFLLCFRYLPDWKKEDAPKRTKIVNMGIAISVGVLFVLIALSIQNADLFASVSSYFENAYELAGGKNIVNTIIGDFRAFDTMLEVTVLLISGIGVFALAKLKARKGD
jgi:multicomponent Na+:H+ antiporter subunit A